ncbi:type III-B CRISPR module-associated Cmr3 family protein [Paenibacillus sp. FSL K6-0108]|uniref:type III-B CRISPR module-associated Cmr3 family protein n=1 Tax=Paenibacillus sp. FSL K6-0108 TaxID=2921417 RepID=UPI0032512184
MRLLTLTPADSFFFKGHMMSEMGLPSQWSGLFPPRPNTVYGALRSAYIHRFSTFEQFRKGSDSQIKAWMGTPTRMGTFRQQAVLIRQNNELLLPVPMDYRIMRTTLEDGQSMLVADALTLKENNSLSNVSAGYTLTRGDQAGRAGKDVDHSGHFVTLGQWQQAVFHHKQMQDIISLSQIVDDYMKTGIKIDAATSKAEDSHFFQMKMLTMRQDCELVSLVSDDGPDFSEVPLVSLGAENRPWYLQQTEMEWSLWSSNQMQQLEQSLYETSIARIILLTPLVLPEDCPLTDRDVPADWMWELVNGVQVQLVTWVTGRPELYGGWDIVANRPKPRTMMLPAGTVFYVKVRQPDIPALLQAASGFTLFAGETEGRDHEGFGFAVIAGTQ